MYALPLVSAVIFIPLLLMPAETSAQNQASLILVHGKIWTENPKQAEAEAVAIMGSRIIAVGDNDTILKLSGPNTKVVELEGRRVVPGFNDAHVHFYMGGDGLTSVQLHEASSPEEFRKTISAFARTLPRGEWILNGSWDHERWVPNRLPTHELIENVTPTNPVLL